MPDNVHILVVDDEEQLRSILSAELSRAGYNVATAADGDEAIASLQNKTFDLVLLDIRMPKVNGFEVLKFAKQNMPTVKVIMLTAFADLKHAVESKKLGATDFITKPYDIEELLATIERALSG